MSHDSPRYRLTRPVDQTDHILGPDAAEITLVEYGSYGCPSCRAVNERIADIRDEFGDRVRYVYRHRPVPGNDIAYRAAVLAEQASPDQFWAVHVELMSRSDALTDADLQAVAAQFGLSTDTDGPAAEQARARIAADVADAGDSGVAITPTFFINGRRYDGAWDECSLSDAMLGSLGHRVRSAALDFASWGPSTGILLLLTTVLALVLTNSAAGPAFTAFWSQYLGLSLGEAAFKLSLQHWVNDGLLTIFFLVVGLEIKREFTVGHLASRLSAALPVAGALGGAIAPALVYLALVANGAWMHGWGIPLATDTAFAIALIVMMGSRVPVELRIFLTAAAIVDDIVAILIVAVFYSGNLNYAYMLAAVVVSAMLYGLNRAGVYRPLPYVLLGLALWFCVHETGLHATLAGVILALLIPTRHPPNMHGLMAQAQAIMSTEAKHQGEALRHGPSLGSMMTLETIINRMESPADRMLRVVTPWSSYLVLPLFAFANAGVVVSMDVFNGHEMLILAIMAGLIVGKPLGMTLVTMLAVRLGWAIKPAEYSWRQLAGAGSLAGIGFTMSLFIAGQAFPDDGDFAAAKIAVFGASIISAVIGVLILLWAGRDQTDEDGEKT